MGGTIMERTLSVGYAEKTKAEHLNTIEYNNVIQVDTISDYSDPTILAALEKVNVTYCLEDRKLYTRLQAGVTQDCWIET